MPDPKISVIIPFLNMRRFLADAVESVYAQTVPDWEILLVDDGSNDGGAEAALDYARRDPDRVRALLPGSSDAHGASAARNRGLQVARGEYHRLSRCRRHLAAGKTRTSTEDPGRIAPRRR